MCIRDRAEGANEDDMRVIAHIFRNRLDPNMNLSLIHICYVCSSREGLGVLYENGEPRYAGEFRQNRMHGRINEIQNGRVLAECVYQDGVLRYEKRYSLSDGKPYLAFEGFMKNGKPGGMGCRYNPYGEKVEEGLYQDGELAKSMQMCIRDSLCGP